jgi:hypothetical protein
MRNHGIKLTFYLLIGILNMPLLWAQGGKQANPKWLKSAGIGICSFTSNGIPPSTTEKSFLYAHGKSYQEEGQLGFLYEGTLLKRLGSKNYLGLTIHGYKDSRFNETLPFEQNIDQLMRDSAFVINTFQSYLNIGLIFQRKLIASTNGKLSLNASLAAGLCINRTPERTEFDPSHTGFNELDSNNVGIWYHVSTKFNNGFYINPNINLEYKIWAHSGIRCEIGQVVQWLSTENQVQVPNKNAYGVFGGSNYRVSAQQFKLSYFF